MCATYTFAVYVNPVWREFFHREGMPIAAEPYPAWIIKRAAQHGVCAQSGGPISAYRSGDWFYVHIGAQRFPDGEVGCLCTFEPGTVDFITWLYHYLSWWRPVYVCPDGDPWPDENGNTPGPWQAEETITSIEELDAKGMWGKWFRLELRE